MPSFPSRKRMVACLVSSVVLLSVNVQALAVTVDSRTFPFVHFTQVNSDISYDGISCMFQDSRGFIWVGTFRGLNRYDGNHFTVYDKTDFGSVSDFIHSIAEDDDGNIWVGTDKGVVIYDYRMDVFRSFTKISDTGTSIRNKVNNIFSWGGNIWITANHQGLFCYDIANDTLVNYFVEDGKQTLPQGIRTITADSSGNFWIGLYYTGLYRTDHNFTSLEEVIPVSSDVSFHGDNIEYVVESGIDGNSMLILSIRNGLCRMDIKTGRLQRLIEFPEDTVPVDCFYDTGKCLWISTTKGLYRYDLMDNSYDVLVSDESDRFALSDSYCNAAIVDREGGLWVGTKDGGVNWSSPQQGNFKKYYSADGRSLSNCIVSGFAMDGNGQVYVTTEKDGLLRYDTFTDRLHRYTLSDIQETICSPVFHGGSLWIGSLHGLLRLDTGTGRLRRYRSFEDAQIEDDRCLALYVSDDDVLYVGTTLGLMKYEPEADAFVQVPGLEGKFITCIDEDSCGRMWVSTYADGIFVIDRSGKITNCSYSTGDLPTDKLSGVFVDARDRIWVLCFSNGFCLYDKMEGRFRHYGMDNVPGLQSETFFSVLDDRKGNLWLSTENGVTEFNPNTNEVFNYTWEVGLLDNVMKNAAMKDSAGNLYLGSQNGFVRFNPDSFNLVQKQPELVLTDFMVGDMRVVPGGDSPLGTNVNLADEIVLKHRQNSFGVTASVLSWATLANNKVEFWLEGYDTGPRVLKSGQTMSWYGLPSGKYILHVNASSISGRWNMSHPPVSVVVRKHPMLSFWAVSGYVIVFCAFIAAGAYVYRRKLRKDEYRRLLEFERELEYNVLSESLSTILLVEDNSAVRKQIRASLSGECNTVSAMSSDMAFQLLDSFRISIVIADADVRNFDALAFCREMVSGRRYRVPIIILSSDTSQGRRIEFMNNNVSLVVEKPFSDDYIQACVRNLMNHESEIAEEISKTAVTMKIRRTNLDEKDEAFLNLLEKVVLDNLGNPDFGSSQMEEAMSMSRSSLVRRMKSLLGTTPNEYLKNRRISVAAEMLRAGNVRVNEICYAVGFRYPSYFAKCFKDVLGVLPADYINIRSNDNNI